MVGFGGPMQNVTLNTRNRGLYIHDLEPPSRCNSLRVDFIRMDLESQSHRY